MKLKPVVDSLDEVDPTAQALYETRGEDGKFYLTLELEPSEEERARVKATVEKERQAKDSAEKRAREAEKKLAELGDITPEMIEELKAAKEAAAEAERKRQEETAKSREEWQALIDNERQAAERKKKEAVEPLQARIAELEAAMDYMVLDEALSRAAAELPVKPSFVPLFKARSREIAKIERPSNGSGKSVSVNGRTVPIPEAVVYVDDIPVPFGEWAANHYAKSQEGLEIVLERQDDGGGAEGGGTRKRDVNPFVKGPNWNLTKQGQLRKSNPALASRLQAEAGIR